jgi:hypothetical protein
MCFINSKLFFHENLAIEFEIFILIIQVNSILHSKLELTQCIPKLKRIRQLLEENPYQGHFDDNDDEENPIRKVSTRVSFLN